MHNMYCVIYHVCSDGRLKPGDEILMVDGKSLVGLSHSEAVSVLKMTQQLVQLVVATEVSRRPSFMAQTSSSSLPPSLPSPSLHPNRYLMVGALVAH